MNKNEKSLVEHALRLYELQYDDNIKLDHYSTCIVVRRRNIQYSYILHLYNETADEPIYKSRNTPSKLNNNIRSFINHWIQYYNFNKTITCVVVRECSYNTFDIAILCDDNCWYIVLHNPHPLVNDWISYNW